MAKSKNIGLEVVPPSKECENDINCPFHGTNVVRGRVFVGTVTKTDTHRSASVSWERQFYLPKYERYEKRTSKIRVHNPACINAQIGDKVKIAECKKISKTKNFVIIEKQK